VTPWDEGWRRTLRASVIIVILGLALAGLTGNLIAGAVFAAVVGLGYLNFRLDEDDDHYDPWEGR